MQEKKLTIGSKILRIIRIIKNIAFAVILTFLVGVIILSVIARVNGEMPSVFGFTLLKVSSSSMEPELKVGDVILSREVDPMTLKKGDIITYEGREGEFSGKRITHRVVKAPYERNGVWYLETKGDASDKTDYPITADQVLGITLTKVDILANLFGFFVTPWGLITIIVLIILAFFNEIVLFVKTILGIRNNEDEESVDDIIARYQREALEEKKREEAVMISDVADKVEGESDFSGADSEQICEKKDK